MKVNYDEDTDILTVILSTGVEEPRSVTVRT